MTYEREAEVNVVYSTPTMCASDLASAEQGGFAEGRYETDF